MTSPSSLRQISLHAPQLQDVNLVEKADYEEELRQFRRNLLRSCPKWPQNFDSCGSPLPFLVPEYLVDHLEKLSDILHRVITSIVERWWTDPIARFSERMPLLEHQESLLKVIFALPTVLGKCSECKI